MDVVQASPFVRVCGLVVRRQGARAGWPGCMRRSETVMCALITWMRMDEMCAPTGLGARPIKALLSRSAWRLLQPLNRTILLRIFWLGFSLILCYEFKRCSLSDFGGDLLSFKGSDSPCSFRPHFEAGPKLWPRRPRKLLLPEVPLVKVPLPPIGRRKPPKLLTVLRWTSARPLIRVNSLGFSRKFSTCMCTALFM